MATCRDCLHIKMCYLIEIYKSDPDETDVEYDCSNFRDRTKFVKAVRCKDCKSYLEDDGGFCLEMDRSIEPHDFCSYGERRGEA